jgi:hypothetical protein
MPNYENGVMMSVDLEFAGGLMSSESKEGGQL